MAIYYIDLYNGNDANDGTSWATAWKTNIGKSAILAAGDLMKVSKTPDPVSIGTALWTDKSKNIILTTPQTKTIDNCEALWTNGIGLSPLLYSSYRKHGGYLYRNRTTTSGWTSGAVLCYKSLASSLDLSTYQEITFFLSYGNALLFDQIRIRLCSDSAGAVPVDEFIIPAIAANEYSTTRLTPMTIAKLGGGNLGSNINSISIAYGTYLTSTYISGKYFMIDNISASKTNGLNLNTLISKNGSPFVGDESFFAIQSIDEDTVVIDNSPACISNTGLGYSGATETVETYIRSPFNSMHTCLESKKSGALGSPITIEGGYNTITNSVDGETYFDGVLGLENGFLLNSGITYNEIRGLSFFRYLAGAKIGNSSSVSTILHSIAEFGELNNNLNYGLQIQGAGIEAGAKHLNNNGSATTNYALMLESGGYAVTNKILAIRSISSNYGLASIVGLSSVTLRMEIVGIAKMANNNNGQNFAVSGIPVWIHDCNFYDNSWLSLFECPNSIVENVSAWSNLTFLSVEKSSWSVIKNFNSHSTTSYPSIVSGVDVLFSHNVLIDNLRHYDNSDNPADSRIALKDSLVKEINAYSVANSLLPNASFKSEHRVQATDGTEGFYLFNQARVEEELISPRPEGVAGRFYRITSTNPNPFIEYTIAEFAAKANKLVTVKIWTGGSIYSQESNLVIEEQAKNGTITETTLSVDLTTANEYAIWEERTITHTPSNDTVLKLKIRGKSNASATYQTITGWGYFGPLTITQAD